MPGAGVSAASRGTGTMRGPTPKVEAKAEEERSDFTGAADGGLVDSGSFSYLVGLGSGVR